MYNRAHEIKRHQKETQLLREISKLFWEASLENAGLRGLMINRVGLTPDKSICNVYFYVPGGKQEFDQRLDLLTLFKPSLRKALSHQLQFRRTPDIVFRFDDEFEKKERLEQLLDKVKDELK